MSTVFFDVDTQLDFVSPAGALYVPGAERILPVVSRLNQYAASHEIVVVSTMDAHLENDQEFQVWPAHCVAGTLGQRKPQGTLSDATVTIGLEPGIPMVDGARQIIFEKRELDCFTNPNLLPLLEQLEADHFVVYGLVTEHCVRYAAAGLVAAGKRVEIVIDAIRTLDESAGTEALRELEAGGASLVNSGSL